ncbi:DUF427 domain-containing protein [Pseudoroseicyclus aestuarii]|uniref:Uncharacterized protein (DUF427 family) n=1 Tax=Pseudoroseicyclus aestuarii TaxID=1795041 RepID=A0A318T5D9_9RHOB|nr:DUF427 domain-containing protein [Pseudoroseicyclus aestuarii]PYE82511.1 uncharacterized protein (DUF427 family) [Pseudoroseicyclus aestuarii]
MTDRITIRPSGRSWVVRADGAVLGESTTVLELLEEGHEPVIYFPREDIAMAFLDASETRTTCPFKGEARYFSIIAQTGAIKDAAWSYEDPKEAVRQIAGHLAFDRSKVAVEAI